MGSGRRGKAHGLVQSRGHWGQALGDRALLSSGAETTLQPLNAHNVAPPPDSQTSALGLKDNLPTLHQLQISVRTGLTLSPGGSPAGAFDYLTVNDIGVEFALRGVSHDLT